MCLILTSISNYIMIEHFGDVKCVTQLKLNWQLQCNAVQLSYSHLHVITIVEMHSTVRIENLYDPRSYFIEIFVLTFKQLVDTFFNYIMQDMRL